MARDQTNPDTAGKDMTMNDVAMWCNEDGCNRPAERGGRYCSDHND